MGTRSKRPVRNRKAWVGPCVERFGDGWVAFRIGRTLPSASRQVTLYLKSRRWRLSDNFTGVLGRTPFEALSRYKQQEAR